MFLKVKFFGQFTEKFIKNLVNNRFFNCLQGFVNWCRWPESNRHGLFNRRILSPVRLPVPPHLHVSNFTG